MKLVALSLVSLQVSAEGYNMDAPIDLDQLDGTWRLQYTSAPDVLVLLEASARLPFLQVCYKPNSTRLSIFQI